MFNSYIVNKLQKFGSNAFNMDASYIYYKDISCIGVLSVDLTLFLQEMIGVKWRGGSWLFRPETIDGKISRRKVTFRFLLLT